jgi:GNAT superfamily N-acetyltransferase
MNEDHGYRQQVRLSGWLYATQLALFKHLPERWFRCQGIVFTVCATARGGPAPDDAPQPRWAGAADTDLLLAAGYQPDYLQWQFARGARAAILVHEGGIVGASWYVAETEDEYPWLRVLLPSGHYWNWDAWIAVPHRRKGWGRVLMAFASRELAALGATHILNSIDVLNRPSRRAFAGAGHQETARLWFVRMGRNVLLGFAGGVSLHRVARRQPLQLQSLEERPGTLVLVRSAMP